MARRLNPVDTRPGRLVLVVDDDARIRESLADLLNSTGIHTLCFSSADALLTSGALANSRCVITDVRMPDLDGMELQKLILARDPSVRIIFISAFQDQQTVEIARASGAFAFLYKPFDGEELLSTVEAALSQAAEY
jgi:FixJ family two-component response regulator